MLKMRHNQNCYFVRGNYMFELGCFVLCCYQQHPVLKSFWCPFWKETFVKKTIRNILPVCQSSTDALLRDKLRLKANKTMRRPILVLYSTYSMGKRLNS